MFVCIYTYIQVLALLELIRDAPTGSAARLEACGVLDLLARCALNLPEIERAGVTRALLPALSDESPVTRTLATAAIVGMSHGQVRSVGQTADHYRPAVMTVCSRPSSA